MSARGRPGDATVPSNYRPLPRGERVAADGDSARGLHGLTREDRLTGMLTVDVVTCTSLRVGSGVAEPVFKGDGTIEIAAGLTQVRARPTIPGSSLKGTLRSLCEAIGGGCDLDGQCAPPCRICALFGQAGEGTALQGRIGFGDLLPVAPSDADAGIVKLPRAFAPRRSVGRRLYGGAPPGMPKDVPHLVLLKGARLRGRVTLANVTEAELGLVLLAGGLDRTFRPRLGGGKFGGLGLIELHVVEVALRRGYRSPAVERLTGPELDAFVARCLAAAPVAPGGDQALMVLRGGAP